MSESRSSQPPPAPEPDPALASAAAPPRPSFEEVYSTLFSYVLRVLWRVGVPSRDLPDVAHEVFLVVHRRLGDYDPRFAMKSWVAGIASYTAMRHLQLARNQRELLLRDDAGSMDIVDPGLDPEQRLAQADTQRIVRGLIQRIRTESNRRAIFVLYEIEHVAMRDIAEAFQISENAAWDRLRHARREFVAAVRRLSARDREALGIRRVGFVVAPFALAEGALLRRVGEAVLDFPEAFGALVWARLQPLLASEGGAGGAVATAAAAAAPGAQSFPLRHGAAEVVPAKEAEGSATRLAQAGTTSARAKLAAAGAALFLGGAGAGAGALYAVLPRAAPTDVALARDRAPVAPSIPGATAAIAAVPAVSAAGGPAPAAATAAVGAPRAAVAPPSGAFSPSDDIDIHLIQRAVAALGAGNAAEALAALDRHGRRYPRSPRAQQREALSIKALAHAGRRAEAAARAARFREIFPGSAYLAAIEDALVDP
ncbi:RNA polymerase sigma factor [Sorangium sp. So ce131]|uniref:RNA polymerase sigma factor n=1 Tax=Sorangium sp. So ce131 TaxID=3133282 RepID=UPI003F6346AD